MEWIQSLQGKRVTPRDLQVDQVGTVEEIAHVLAAKARFSGHTLVPYSVAEHCVRGARLLPQAFRGAFLLHELGEVYLPDIPSPIKPYLQVFLGEGGAISWEGLEIRHTRVILQALGLSSMEPMIYAPEVKAMDLAMLMAEATSLLGPPPEPWGIEVAPAPTGHIVPWTWTVARDEWLKGFRECFS